jgi:hypothetical protein
MSLTTAPDPITPAIPERPWPTSVGELMPEERLALFAFRAWVSGQENWATAADVLANRLETDPNPALRALTRVILVLTKGARRTIRYHRPGCPCLGADEAWFLCLTAAAQARHLRLLDALARWVVHEEAAAETISAAQVFADALSDAEVLLPLRTRGGDCPPSRGAGLHTVH